MNPASREWLAQSDAHWQMAALYWENALDAALRQEWAKVSELLFGAASRALKGYGALRAQTWQTHHGTDLFLDELAREEKDSFYHRVQRELRALHGYFYDGDPQGQDVREAAQKVHELMKRLYRLSIRP